MTEAPVRLCPKKAVKRSPPKLAENGDAPVAQSVGYYGRTVVGTGPRGIRDSGRHAGVEPAQGQRRFAAIEGCSGADIVITNQEMQGLAGVGWHDIIRLHEAGALAGWIEAGKLQLI
jgi:competence protein ComEC